MGVFDAILGLNNGQGSISGFLNPLLNPLLNPEAGPAIPPPNAISTTDLPPVPGVDMAQPRAARTNNPGAIEFGPFAQSMGATRSDGRYAIFDTVEQGYAAQERLLQSYVDRGFNTVDKIVRRWAPLNPKDPNQNQTGYINHVSRQLGIDPNQPIPRERIPQLAEAMASFEAGRPIPRGQRQTAPDDNSGMPPVVGGQPPAQAGPPQAIIPPTNIPQGPQGPRRMDPQQQSGPFGFLQSMLPQQSQAPIFQPNGLPMQTRGETGSITGLLGRFMGMPSAQELQIGVDRFNSQETNSAQGEIMQRALEIRAANPQLPPPQMLQAILADPAVVRNIPRIPAVQMQSLVSSLVSSTAPQVPNTVNLAPGASQFQTDPNTGQPLNGGQPTLHNPALREPGTAEQQAHRRLVAAGLMTQQQADVLQGRLTQIDPVRNQAGDIIRYNIVDKTTGEILNTQAATALTRQIFEDSQRQAAVAGPQVTPGLPPDLQPGAGAPQIRPQATGPGAVDTGVNPLTGQPANIPAAPPVTPPIQAAGGQPEVNAPPARQEVPVGRAAFPQPTPTNPLPRPANMYLAAGPEGYVKGVFGNAAGNLDPAFAASATNAARNRLDTIQRTLSEMRQNRVFAREAAQLAAAHPTSGLQNTNPLNAAIQGLELRTQLEGIIANAEVTIANGLRGAGGDPNTAASRQSYNDAVERRDRARSVLDLMGSRQDHEMFIQEQSQEPGLFPSGIREAITNVPGGDRAASSLNETGAKRPNYGTMSAAQIEQILTGPDAANLSKADRDAIVRRLQIIKRGGEKR